MSPVYPERCTVRLERNTIREAIKKSGFTQRQIAVSCHVSHDTLRRAMRGESITLQSASLIASGLKMRIRELWPELRK